MASVAEVRADLHAANKDLEDGRSATVEAKGRSDRLGQSVAGAIANLKLALDELTAGSQGFANAEGEFEEGGTKCRAAAEHIASANGGSRFSGLASAEEECASSIAHLRTAAEAIGKLTIDVATVIDDLEGAVAKLESIGSGTEFVGNEAMTSINESAAASEIVTIYATSV